MEYFKYSEKRLYIVYSSKIRFIPILFHIYSIFIPKDKAFKINSLVVVFGCFIPVGR